MAGNDGRFVQCGHCTENIAGICFHCGGDHHGHNCPTLRGVQPFTPEELEHIQERLSVSPGVVSELLDPPDSGDLITLLVRDYRRIQVALRGNEFSSLSDWHSGSDGEALGILQILYGSGVKE